MRFFRRAQLSQPKTVIDVLQRNMKLKSCDKNYNIIIHYIKRIIIRLFIYISYKGINDVQFLAVDYMNSTKS